MGVEIPYNCPHVKYVIDGVKLLLSIHVLIEYKYLIVQKRLIKPRNKYVRDGNDINIGTFVLMYIFKKIKKNALRNIVCSGAAKTRAGAGLFN